MEQVNIRELIELEQLYEKYCMENRRSEFFHFEEKKSERRMHLRSLIFNQIYWEKANEYLEIVDSFVNNELAIEDFRTKFYDLRHVPEDNSVQLLERLKQEVLSNQLTLTEIEINPRSKGFINAIDDWIFNLLEMYNPDLTLDDDLKNEDNVCFSGSFIRILINNNIRPTLKKYCDK